MAGKMMPNSTAWDFTFIVLALGVMRPALSQARIMCSGIPLVLYHGSLAAFTLTAGMPSRQAAVRHVLMVIIAFSTAVVFELQTRKAFLQLLARTGGLSSRGAQSSKCWQEEQQDQEQQGRLHQQQQQQEEEEVQQQQQQQQQQQVQPTHQSRLQADIISSLEASSAIIVNSMTKTAALASVAALLGPEFAQQLEQASCAVQQYQMHEPLSLALSSYQGMCSMQAIGMKVRAVKETTGY